MEATEALELIVDHLAKAGYAYWSDYASVRDLLSTIEELAISYEEMDFDVERCALEEK